MSFPSLSFQVSTIRFAIEWTIPISDMQSGVSVGPGPPESNRKSHMARSMEKAQCLEVCAQEDHSVMRTAIRAFMAFKMI